MAKNNNKKSNKMEQIKSQAKKIENNVGKKHKFKDFKNELKRVIWPSKKEWWENIVVVLSMVIIVSLVILALDFAFKALNKLEVQGVEKIKNRITTNEIVDSVSNEISTNELTIQ